MGNKQSSSSKILDGDSSEPSLSSISESSEASNPTKQSSSRSFKRYVPGPSPVPEDASPAMRTAIQWVAAKNRHDVMKLYCLSDHEATFHFVDADVHMPMREFWNTTIDAFEAFPDMKFTYWDIQELRPGVIRLVDYVGAGHQTRNMSFGDNPILPPTGQLFADEPVELTLTVNEENKITRCVADAKGQLVGPPGFYIKIQRYLAQNKEQETAVTAKKKKPSSKKVQA